MNKGNLIIRVIIFIFVTIAFFSLFYFYFKNSRASSPLQDEKYMEQLNVLSKKYKIVSPTVPTPTPALIKESKTQNFVDVIIEAVAKFFDRF